jgi:enterobactin synthetase component D / holo-[acyl-carrier protein] synthase
VLELLVPHVVCVRESRLHRTDITLFPEEEAALEGVVEKRRREFTTVRACARDALAALGLPATPIVPADGGAPAWPAGVVGSMTHCAGYNAAALACDAHLIALGIDAEPDERLSRSVIETFADDDEIDHLDSLPPGQHAWERVLFSAKESVFKAWFSVTRRWLDNRDVTVTLRTDGTFTARILAQHSVGDTRWEKVHGRWLSQNQLILTAVAIPTAEAARSSRARGR